MLDFMRRQRSALKWVWVILIFIFSVTLVTLYIPFGDLPNVSITNDVASIGHDSISSHEFQSAYRNYIDRMRGQLNPEMLRAFRFERQIMDALVTRHVMTEEAKRLGLNVSSAEIEQKILENPVCRENGTFIGQSRYQAVLAQNNLTIDEFESNVGNEILTKKLRSFITAAIRKPKKNTNAAMRRESSITSSSMPLSWKIKYRQVIKNSASITKRTKPNTRSTRSARRNMRFWNRSNYAHR